MGTYVVQEANGVLRKCKEGALVKLEKGYCMGTYEMFYFKTFFFRFCRTLVEVGEEQRLSRVEWV